MLERARSHLRMWGVAIGVAVLGTLLLGIVPSPVLQLLVDAAILVR